MDQQAPAVAEMANPGPPGHFSRLIKSWPHTHTVKSSRFIGYIQSVMSLSSLVKALPSDETWGPPTTTDALVDGVPYAPYSKGDKLGRMADWTSEGKDGRDGRGGRQQYNRNYRGNISSSRELGKLWLTI